MQQMIPILSLLTAFTNSNKKLAIVLAIKYRSFQVIVGSGKLCCCDNFQLLACQLPFQLRHAQKLYGMLPNSHNDCRSNNKPLITIKGKLSEYSTNTEQLKQKPIVKY